MENEETTQTEETNEDALPEIDIPALFAADLPEEIVPFRIGKCAKESQVHLLPMNADKMARYRTALTKFAQQVSDEGKEQYLAQIDWAEIEVALLLGTVTKIEAYSDQDGVPTARPFPPPGPGRVNYFKEMHPTLRTFLVGHCKKVNGLAPLG